ncbi:hypothetical protein N0M98_24515 [Paenibacillus doosanensis]|uniref:hypothetical protein n=1 Tax=Paenibacillus konkukensis TaxID=2020716 RepID=UPI00201D906E|nr:hypothetical protein [Paenibacillus konkukensis]MCS7463291.1 hypothetical protein [Paenibacillus doosanensis]
MDITMGIIIAVIITATVTGTPHPTAEVPEGTAEAETGEEAEATRMPARDDRKRRGAAGTRAIPGHRIALA